jgi:hypothetical protein
LGAEGQGQQSGPQLLADYEVLPEGCQAKIYNLNNSLRHLTPFDAICHQLTVSGSVNPASARRQTGREENEKESEAI